jgi:ACS family tartrate transporter-like MFS transporter
MTGSVERTTIRKIYWRLLPLLFVAYFVCYLDRINIGFAALTMNRELGFSATVFGWGAGVFYLGYCLFEVPSNIALARFGARLWIARIMISWGVLSAGMAFITGETSLFVVRALLGAAEAGFFPGMILFFTYWFPPAHRGRVVGLFMTAIPVSIALGGPVSTALLELDGWLGLAGWRWLFLGEAVPAVLLGVAVLIWLVDRPADARWLTAAERAWLVGELQAERRAIEQTRVVTMLQSLLDWRVLALSAIYFGIATGSVGLVIFLPQIVRQLGVSNLMTGFVTAIPYVVGTIGMMIWGHVTDRLRERRWNLFVACLTASVGLIVAGMLTGSYWALVGMAAATVGFYGMKAPFWPLPSTFLTGSAAAAAIALINSLGNAGGFVGPIVVGRLRDATGSFEAGLYVLTGCALMSAIVTLVAVRAPRRHGATPAGIELPAA